MKNNTLIRIIIDIIILISIVKGWWLIALPLAVFAIWSMPLFIESIIAGIAYDALFGFVPGLGIWSYAGTIVSVLTFSIIMSLKNRLR